MLWLILTIVCLIVVGISVIVSVVETSAGAIATGTLTGIGWVVLTIFLSVHTVGQRQVGIVYNFSGTITGKVDPGVAWTAPWQHVKKENVGLQREDFTLDETNSAVSKDQQAIFAHFTVNYQVEPAKVVDLFKRVGPAWKQTLLDSRALQDFKEVTSGFTAQEMTTKRPELRERTKQALAAELARYDITVVDIFVTNLSYSHAYENAIDAKNRQVQKALQAEAKVRQAQAEADQAVAKAKGEAISNRLISNSCSERCIRLRSIEKLNPQVQVVYVPGGSNLFVPQLAAKP